MDLKELSESLEWFRSNWKMYKTISIDPFHSDTPSLAKDKIRSIFAGAKEVSPKEEKQ